MSVVQLNHNELFSKELERVLKKYGISAFALAYLTDEGECSHAIKATGEMGNLELLAMCANISIMSEAYQYSFLDVYGDDDGEEND